VLAAAQIAEVIAYIGAALLLPSGALKLAKPATTVEALAGAGLAPPPLLVRMLGGIELCAGIACLVVGGTVSFATVASLYATFTAFTIYALASKGRLASCACFGSSDSPPTRVHAGFTGCVAAAAVASVHAPTLADRVLPLSATHAVYLADVALAAGCGYLVIAALSSLGAAAAAPRAFGSVRRTSGLAAPSLVRVEPRTSPDGSGQ
jgi:hypothetical protein